MRYRFFFPAFILTAAILLLNENRIQAQGPFNIGTMNPGDSILIIYSVTVDNPLPPGVTQIINQGTVTGSNFTDVSTNDPNRSGATITDLNMYALPVTFGSFRAYEKNTAIELAWKILTEINTHKYEIEKSTNGRTFQKIGEVIARNTGSADDYTFLDNNPAADNFYRLRVLDKDGKFKYSPIVRVKTGSSTTQQLTLYPNPVTGKQVNVQMTKLARGRYEFVLYNAHGQIAFRKYIDHAGGSASEVVQLPASLSSGVYQVVLRKNDVSITKSIIMY